MGVTVEIVKIGGPKGLVYLARGVVVGPRGGEKLLMLAGRQMIGYGDTIKEAKQSLMDSVIKAMIKVYEERDNGEALERALGLP